MKLIVLTILSTISLAPLSALAGSQSTGDKVSTVGQYRGYSEQIYPNVVRISQYVAVRDGTKLAADIYRPADKDGKIVEDPLPVLFNVTPYNRNTPVLGLKEWFLEIVKYGYVVSVLDTRGRGASYGPYLGGHRRVEAWDGYDLTEWFAAQPWSDGNVGMLGCSFNLPHRTRLREALITEGVFLPRKSIRTAGHSTLPRGDKAKARALSSCTIMSKSCPYSG